MLPSSDDAAKRVHDATTTASATAAVAAADDDDHAVVNGAAMSVSTSRASSFFAFAKEGALTWWSAALLVALAAATVGAVVVLALASSSSSSSSSSTRHMGGAASTHAALRALGAAYCPWLSPVLSPIAFTAWRTTCASVPRGQLAACHSAVDCLLHGPACASPAVLAQLQCVHATPSSSSAAAAAADDDHPPLPPRVGYGAGVCALVASPQLVRADGGGDGDSRAPRATPALVDAFCTAPHTRCAVCVGDACTADTPVVQCVHEDACRHDDDDNASQWWCA